MYVMNYGFLFGVEFLTSLLFREVRLNLDPGPYTLVVVRDDQLNYSADE